MYIWKSSVFWENTIVRRFCIRSTPLIDFLLPGGVPHQHGKEVRKRGSFGRLVGVVTRTFRPLANLRPRRCFPVSASPPDRPSPLFDEKIREERPTPRVWHIGFPSTVLLSRSLFFSRDEVIDIFHEKNRRIYVYVNTLAAIGLSKGENFRSSYWFFVFFLLVLYFRFEGIDDWWSLKNWEMMYAWWVGFGNCWFYIERKFVKIL